MPQETEPEAYLSDGTIDRCSIGLLGGQCPSLADYVAVTGTRDGATAAGGPFMWPSLKAGPPTGKATEAYAKYIITDMYAKAAQGMSAEDAVKWAEGELKKIYET